MKLRNKLIPLLSVAATATTIAPLATSCTKSSEINMINVMNGYTPTIKRHSAQSGLTKAAIFNTYVDDVKKNPEIMTQDLAWYESQALPVRLLKIKNRLVSTKLDEEESLINSYGLYVSSTDEVTITPRDIQFGIANPSFKEVTIVNPSTYTEEKVMTVSLEMSYHFDYDVVAHGVNVTQNNMPQTFYRQYTNHYKATFKNLPIVIESGKMGDNLDFSAGVQFAYTGLWNITTDGWTDQNKWKLDKIQDWTFDFDRTEIAKDSLTDMEGNVFNATYDGSTKGSMDTTAKLNAFINRLSSNDILPYVFNFGSFYLYDLTTLSEEIASIGEFDGSDFGFAEASFHYIYIYIMDHLFTILE